MGYLQGNNIPYQRYIERGYFDTGEVTKHGRNFVFPLIKGKGQRRLFEEISAMFPPNTVVEETAVGGYNFEEGGFVS